MDDGKDDMDIIEGNSVRSKVLSCVLSYVRFKKGNLKSNYVQLAYINIKNVNQMNSKQ